MAPVLPKEIEITTETVKPKDQTIKKEKPSIEKQADREEKAKKFKEQIVRRKTQGTEKVPEKNDAVSNRMEEFFEWQPPPPPETMGQKFARKVKQNPFVPIGSICTLGALSYGLISFVRGDKRMQQYMMRARVLAQGGTIIAITVGLGIMLYREGDKKTNKGAQ